MTLRRGAECVLDADAVIGLRRLSEEIDTEWVARALRDSGRGNVRLSKLPAAQVVWLIIAMALLRDRLGSGSHFDHGYAVTVYKSQGATVNEILVLASTLFDSHVSYVAMSRHKYDVRLYWSEDVFGTRDRLMDCLTRASVRCNALDYAAAHDMREEFFPLDRPSYELRRPEESAAVRRKRMKHEVGEMSDRDLVQLRESIQPNANKRIIKPSDIAIQDETLKVLSRRLDAAHYKWINTAKSYDAIKNAFVGEHSKSMPKSDAHGMWESHGSKQEKAIDAQREMIAAFEARESVISRLQALRKKSRSAETAMKEAAERNRETLRWREQLHVVEREIERRRVEELQSRLDAVEFNIVQRLRMWVDAAGRHESAVVDLAYAGNGKLREVWRELRAEQRQASDARYELSGIAGCRGAFFVPLDGRLPTGRQDLERAVIEARRTYRKATRAWGMWRAKHSIEDARAARLGQGEGVGAYQAFVVAERTHQRVQRAYLECVVMEELAKSETAYLRAAETWRAYAESHPDEVATAYKGKGKAGELWKAEREAQDVRAMWESQHDWIHRRGRDHIFPQPQEAGTRKILGLREKRVMEVAAEWEQWKAGRPDEEVHQARTGQGEGSELYQRYRVTLAERQHSRREYRIERTEKELSKLENRYAAAHRRLTGTFGTRSQVERAICEKGKEGRLWLQHAALDRKRKRLEKRLDKLLRVNRDEPRGVAQEAAAARGTELGRKWFSAENALHAAADAWKKVPALERRRARIGFGEHADTYDAYRCALATRDAFREPLVSDVRTRNLDNAERKFVQAMREVDPNDPTTHRVEVAANRERLAAQKLLDRMTRWKRPALHPQPDVTPDRVRDVETRFGLATDAWMQWKESQSREDIARARSGDVSCEGAAIYAAYRHADIEREHVRVELGRLENAKQHERETALRAEATRNLDEAEDAYHKAAVALDGYRAAWPSRVTRLSTDARRYLDAEVRASEKLEAVWQQFRTAHGISDRRQSAASSESRAREELAQWRDLKTRDPEAARAARLGMGKDAHVDRFAQFMDAAERRRQELQTLLEKARQRAKDRGLGR